MQTVNILTQGNKKHVGLAGLVHALNNVIRVYRSLLGFVIDLPYFMTKILCKKSVSFFSKGLFC